MLGIKYSIKFENPFEGIKNYAIKNDANLIVMGSKGVSDFEEMIFFWSLVSVKIFWLVRIVFEMIIDIIIKIIPIIRK